MSTEPDIIAELNLNFSEGWGELRCGAQIRTLLPGNESPFVCRLGHDHAGPHLAHQFSEAHGALTRIHWL